MRRWAHGASLGHRAPTLPDASGTIGSDDNDPRRADLKTPCQLYNLDCAAYESVLVGLFTIWRGQFPERPKPNEVCVGYSRDGWSWTRPDRRGFCPIFQVASNEPCGLWQSEHCMKPSFTRCLEGMENCARTVAWQP